MKYVVLFALPLMLIGQSKVEPFEFTLYLEDGKGNKDSLVLGYHPEATAYLGIDTAFSEVDISATPFNKVFEARLVRHITPTPIPNVPFAPHFKREIVSPFCFLPDSGFFIMFQLAIRIENFPLTLKWNRELFDSLKYPCHSGSYFDVNQFVLLLPFLLPEYKRRLSKTETYTYDIIPLEGSVHWFKGSYNGALSDGSMGKIYSLYFVFDSGLGVVSTRSELLDPSHIYPNPTSGRLSIKAPLQSQLRFTDIWGRELVLEVQRKGEILEIDVSRLPNGIYQVAIEEKGKAPRVGRWVKE